MKFILKLLFGNKKKKIQTPKKIVKSNASLVSDALGKGTTKERAQKKVRGDGTEDPYFKMFLLDSEEIRITDFNKKLTATYKVDKPGTLALFEKYWNQNQSLFTIDDTFRLLKRIVPMLKKEKWGIEKIEGFIDAKLSHFRAKSKLENLYRRAKIYKKVDRQLTIDFLANTVLKKKPSATNRHIAIDAILMYSDLLYEAKQYDESFVALTRTEQILPVMEPYLQFQKGISIEGQRAQICLNQTKANYDSYLFYEFTRLMLIVARELKSFPNLEGFERSIDGLSFHFQNEDWDRAFNEMKMSDYREDIQNEIVHFVSTKLPEIYGIPFELNNSKKIEVAKKAKSPSRLELIEMRMSMEATGTEAVILDISLFASALFQKYYDKSIGKEPE